MRFLLFSAILIIFLAANLFAGAMSVDVYDFIPDPGEPDTISVESKFGGNIAPTVVSVYFYNDQPLRGVQAALTWDNSVLDLDSVSFVGSRLNTDPTIIKGGTIIFDTVIIYAIPFTGPDIAPGNGLMAKLYYSYPDNIGPLTITIDSTTVTDGPQVQTSFFSTVNAEPFVPQFVPGILTFTGTACCLGIRGNVNNDPEDKIDISDLTYIVNYIFRGGPPPPCTLEGNTDGTLDESVDISDLTYLVDYLFRLGPPPPSCP